MNETTTIIRVINTLNQISVSGADNLDKLLGCILALRRMVEKPANAQADECQPDNAQPVGVTIEPQDE